jgi:hemoglobin
VTDLVERLGGRAVLDPVVADFYDRVMADPELAPIFAGVDVERLVGMQRQFLAAALAAGPDASADRVREIHDGHGITAHHFSRFVEHFVLTLEDHDVPGEVVLDVAHHLDLYADDVVGDTAEVG